MGDVINLFGPRPTLNDVVDYGRTIGGTGSTGTIHIWMVNPRDFELSHESSSGNSWGPVERADSVTSALSLARKMAHEYGGDCEIYIPPDMAILIGGAA